MLNINPKTIRAVQCIETKQQEAEGIHYSLPRLDIKPFIPDVYALAHKTEESNFDILDMHEFIAAQAAGNECRLAAATVGS